MPPIIVTMIHSKAALMTGGRLGVSKEQSTNENKIDPELSEQNKAFGKLKFGDSPPMVLQKLREDENLSVNYFHDGTYNVTFKVGDDKFFMEPEFYQEKLYQVVIRTRRFDYWGSSFFAGGEYSGTIESGWKSLIKLISNSYGPASSTQDVWLPPLKATWTHVWYLNKKRILIFLGPESATCLIADVEMEQKAEKEKEQKDNELFSDKSKYF